MCLLSFIYYKGFTLLQRLHLANELNGYKEATEAALQQAVLNAATAKARNGKRLLDMVN